MSDSSTLQIPIKAELRLPPVRELRAEPAPQLGLEVPAGGRREWWPLVVLGLLTLVGGVLRFAFLDRPSIWGDEAMTFMRVSGSFQQMLDALQDWGFVPLHYELYWWIRQQTELTPFMMRLVPAVAGTLMVPAMYWLAVQLAGVRVALTAALLTATSAYLLNYSRDAKMYMHFWLMCTVNFAAFLWWHRTHRRVAWWSWVASGTAMLGLHMIGLAILAIELLALFVLRRFGWGSLVRFALLNVVGLLILVGLAWWRPSNLSVVPKLLVMFGLMPVVALLAPLQWTALAALSERGRAGRFFGRMFAGFHWPPIVLFLLGGGIMLLGPAIYYTHFNRYVDRVERHGLAGGGLHWVEGYNRGRTVPDLLLYTATAHLYSWEWPRRVDQRQIDVRVLRALKTAGIVILGLLALGLLPWRALARSRPPAASEWLRERFRIGWPARVMILSAWLVLPAYGWYCASEEKFVSPPEAIASLVVERPAKRLDWPTVYDIGWRPLADGKFAEKWSAASAAFTAQFYRENLRRPEGWLGWSLAAFAVALAVLSFFACGRTMNQRLYKLAILITIFLSLFVLCSLIYLVYLKRHEGSVWMPRYLGFAWPAVAITAAILLMRLPTRPLRWGAVALLVAVNLANFSARVFAGSEPPTALMAQDLIDSQPRDATTRMYWGVRVEPSGAPGTGNLRSVPGGYYLTVLSGQPTTPDELIQAFRWGGRWARKWRMWPGMNLVNVASSIRADTRRAPHLERIVVWENPRELSGEDRVLAALGDDWQRVGESIHLVRDHWTWRHLNTLRRRVYEKVPAATTAPSAAPATAPGQQ